MVKLVKKQVATPNQRWVAKVREVRNTGHRFYDLGEELVRLKLCL